MRRSNPHPVLAIAAVALTGAAAVAFGAAPTPAPTPQVAETVPAWKLAKVVRQREMAEMRVRTLRRTLMHTPSVQEALTIASVAYAVPRSELSSVAFCESRHTPTARNGRYRGLFQFGPIFESSPYGRAGLSVWSPLAASMAAAYIVRHGGRGWSPWECSPRGAFRP